MKLGSIADLRSGNEAGGTGTSRCNTPPSFGFVAQDERPANSELRRRIRESRGRRDGNQTHKRSRRSGGPHNHAKRRNEPRRSYVPAADGSSPRRTRDYKIHESHPL